MALLGCNDRAVRPPIFVADRPDEPDMSLDSEEPDFNDPECRGRFEGEGCILARGTGTCVRGECRVLACEFGWADCNSDRVDGCETSVSTSESCGTCELACEPDQTCQAGERGFTCSAGRLCPKDRFDLDFDASNGCEWELVWDDAQSVFVPFLEVFAAFSTDQGLVYAGDSDAGLALVYKGRSVQLPVTPTGEFQRLELLPNGQAAMVWEDVVVEVGPGFEDVVEIPADCSQWGPRRFHRGFDNEGELVRVQGFENALRVGEEVLDRTWYLNAFWDDFSASEKAQCEVCALAGCFDTCDEDVACAECAATDGACPDFEVLDVEFIEQKVVVLTLRGLVVIDTLTDEVWRAEREFEPGVAGGAEFVGIATRGDDLALLSGAGLVRWLRFENGFQTLAPDMAVEAMNSPEILGFSSLGALLEREGEGLLLAPANVSGRVIRVNGAGSTQGLADRLVGFDPAQNTLIFSGGGLIQKVRFVQIP